MKTPTSDPGTSASLTPFCKTDGLFFDSSHEPESFKYEFDKDLHESFDEDSMVKPSFNTLEDYFNYSLGIDEIVDRFSITEIDADTNICLVPAFNVDIGNYIKDDVNIDDDDSEPNEDEEYEDEDYSDSDDE